MTNGHTDKTKAVLTRELDEPSQLAADLKHSGDVAYRLETSELRYRRLFEAAQDGILILDVDTAAVNDVNPFLADMLGYSKEELLGKKLWDIGSFRDSELTKSAFAELQTKGYIRYEDLPLETRDGRQISVEFVSNAYSVGNERVIQCNIRDITERKEAQEALLQSQRQQLEIRDRFLSRMSHELRSPLTPIHQFITILLDGLAGNLKPEQREYLTIALNNVNLLRNMVRDLLEVTRAESGKLDVDLRCVYLTELIPQVLKTYQLSATGGLQAYADIPDDLPPVYADPNRIRQVLDNLLDNAVKFSPEKGRIGIRAQVPLETPGFVRIAVADDGCGISPEEHEKIFTYLYQVQHGDEAGRKGLGIGLYICRELVYSHGGRIWVESQLGHGSTFYFTLPVFSLQRQFASVVTAASLIADSITLLKVEISHVGKCRLKGKADQTALWEAWNILQTCTVPNAAVLLPKISDRGLREIFFLVAFANRTSAEALVEQLHRRLEFCQGLRDAELYAQISFTVLDIPARGSRSMSKKLVGNIAGRVEDLMKAALNKRGTSI